jgi:hypothetical protein
MEIGLLLVMKENYPPSIDREDTSKGYVEGNLRWLTHLENSRLGGYHRKT